MEWENGMIWLGNVRHIRHFIQQFTNRVSEQANWQLKYPFCFFPLILCCTMVCSWTINPEIKSGTEEWMKHFTSINVQSVYLLTTGYHCCRACASSRMFEAKLTSLFVNTSAWTAELRSKPMDTSAAIEDSGGSWVAVCAAWMKHSDQKQENLLCSNYIVESNTTNNGHQPIKWDQLEVNIFG